MKSPSARDVLRPGSAYILPLVTHDPAVRMRTNSSGYPGLWSVVQSRRACPRNHTSPLESPQCASVTLYIPVCVPWLATALTAQVPHSQAIWEELLPIVVRKYRSRSLNPFLKVECAWSRSGGTNPPFSCSSLMRPGHISETLLATPGPPCSFCKRAFYWA